MIFEPGVVGGAAPYMLWKNEKPEGVSRADRRGEIPSGGTKPK